MLCLIFLRIGVYLYHIPDNKEKLLRFIERNQEFSIRPQVPPCHRGDRRVPPTAFFNFSRISFTRKFCAPRNPLKIHESFFFPLNFIQNDWKKLGSFLNDTKLDGTVGFIFNSIFACAVGIINPSCYSLQ